VITRVGRRALEIGVGMFALLGFCFVPLGKKTGLEHLKAIVSTGPAQDAGRELLEAGLRLRARMFERAPEGAASETGAARPRSGEPTGARRGASDAGPVEPEALMCVAPLARADTGDAGVPTSLPQ
jgi:hypothetical protein